MKASTLLLLSLSIALSAPTQAKLFRWVDENGKVHFSDKIPPSAAKNKQQELDSRGYTIKERAAALTPEERAREAELERHRQEQQRLVEKQREQDRVLLRTFRNEDDIIMARNGKLSSLDAKIVILRSNIRRLKARLGEKQAHAAQLELAGNPIPANLQKQLDSLRQDIRRNYQQLIRQELHKQDIREDYAKDLSRFRSLKKLSSEKASIVPERKRSAMLDTLITCSQECDKLWEKAEAYARKHATTRMQLLGDNIIMTRSAMAENDISITVSRIKKEEKEGVEEFFIDVQCKESPVGKELCNSPHVEAIRKGFSALHQEDSTNQTAATTKKAQ